MPFRPLTATIGVPSESKGVAAARSLSSAARVAGDAMQVIDRPEHVERGGESAAQVQETEDPVAAAEVDGGRRPTGLRQCHAAQRHP